MPRPAALLLCVASRLNVFAGVGGPTAAAKTALEHAPVRRRLRGPLAVALLVSRKRAVAEGSLDEAALQQMVREAVLAARGSTKHSSEPKPAVVTTTPGASKMVPS